MLKLVSLRILLTNIGRIYLSHYRVRTQFIIDSPERVHSMLLVRKCLHSLCNINNTYIQYKDEVVLLRKIVDNKL